MAVIDTEKVERYTQTLQIPVYRYSATLWHEPIGLALDIIDAAYAGALGKVDLIEATYSAGFVPRGVHSAASGSLPAVPTNPPSGQWLISAAGTMSGVTYRKGDILSYVDGQWYKSPLGYDPDSPGTFSEAAKSSIFSAVLDRDGPGSGLSAQFLNGQPGSYYASQADLLSAVTALNTSISQKQAALTMATDGEVRAGAVADMRGFSPALIKKAVEYAYSYATFLKFSD